MNKRPHPGGLGLPAKPYTPPQAGPAPPLPAGQPPQQQQQYGGDQQAAHAAAWAAYYQSQGAAAGQAAGYGGGGGAAPADSSAPNPYANYGYGAGATHAQGYSGGQQGGHTSPQQSYNQQPGYNNQQAGYNQNYQQGGYGQSPGYNQNAGYNQQQGQQGYGGWGANYGPQQPQPQPLSPNPTAGGYTPQNSNQYYGQQGGGGQPGFRPPQNRPYQPQPGGPSGPGPRGSPARPPPGGPGPSGPGGPGGPGGFPPAKRPRFDGPGGPGGGMPPRPPNPRPPPGYGSGHARPMNERGGGGGRGGAPSNAPIPRIGFGGPPQRPQRGGMRGGGPMGRGGGMMGRGPPMRQRDPREMRPPRTNQRVEASPQQARKRKDKDTKEARTTMTDFRIVGIEVKGLDWSWGLVGEHVVDDKEDDKEKDVKAEPNVEETKPEADVKSEAKPADEQPGEAAVKTEDPAEVKPEGEAEPKPEADTAVETEDTPDVSDEKRGEKRKAKPSSVDGDDAQSPKKRTFILTHNKVNTPGEGPSPESNQNRFRIYFESPPELDRVPKSARRNPNKRWRRESTTLTETLHEETHEETHQAQDETTAEAEGVKTEAPEVTATPNEESTAKSAPKANGDEPNGEKTEEAPAEVKPETAEGAETKPAESGEPGTEPASEAPVVEAPAETEEKEEAVDVSMVTDPGTVEGAEHEHEEHSGLTGAEASAAELETALAESAQNAASAYGSRQKPRGRRWSTSSIGSDNGSDAGTVAGDGVTQPSVNRVSVLYEDSTRRLVFDASVVQKVRIFRGEGRIEVDLLPQPKEAVAVEGEGEETKEVTEETELPKGVLVETKDAAENRFVAVSREKLGALWKDEADKSLPPLHRIFGATSEPVTLTVFLNKKKPLSEPKWCRTNQADEWLYEQFGRRAASDAGWRGKLEIMDPDAPPTLSNILETWKGGSNTGTAEQRAEFTSSLLATPNDLLEILLRLTRGERNPTASIGTGPTSANGPLATAIRPDSPYASHQTHVSLAILAMYRLTTDYASQAGVKTEVLNDQIADIIRSLPSHMIHKSLDGLYKEWLAERRV